MPARFCTQCGTERGDQGFCTQCGVQRQCACPCGCQRVFQAFSDQNSSLSSAEAQSSPETHISSLAEGSPDAARFSPEELDHLQRMKRINDNRDARKEFERAQRNSSLGA